MTNDELVKAMNRMTTQPAGRGWFAIYDSDYQRCGDYMTLEELTEQVRRYGLWIGGFQYFQW